MASLLRRLPQFHELSSGDAVDVILTRFLDECESRGLTLYPAQEESLLALFAGDNVILNTPTGSGKSLVAEALVFHSMSWGRRSVYTCPIKALVNEKFLSLCRLFGAENVGLMTGDGSVNREAPILCCTAEILANMALTEGTRARVDDVVMDEFHYYADRERGVAWQLPLLELSQTRFLLMSATLGDLDGFAKRLTELNAKPTRVVVGDVRPVELEFEYRGETHLHESLQDLLARDRAPIYLVNFTQAAAIEEAQSLMSVDLLSKEQKQLIQERLRGEKFRSPFGRDLQRFLKHGVGVHHAGLLPRYRILVESMAQEGLLKVISGTDTLGVGVNVPIRTVLLTKLCKYDGEKTAILSARDFHQIAGRAGRRGFDTRGFVVAQAPEHVIENLRQDRKAALDPKKAKKLVRAKPPEKGFVMWTEDSFKKLQAAKPEPLPSRFRVDHALVLSVLTREHEDGCQALRSLIRRSHESDHAKRKHRARGFELFRSLVERKLIDVACDATTGERRYKLHENWKLQIDFSLHQSLSLWLIDALDVLDRDSPTYALDVITLCESICENPDVILRRQADRARDAVYRELKAEGVEFDERQARLDEVEYPKPLREFIYEHFNAWSDQHPWVGTENIRPKSIVREMFEKGMGFHDYIREYDLQRAEGLLLRALNEVYKVLAQTVPDTAKTDELRELETALALTLRSIDSSLLEEWGKLREQAEGLRAKPASATVSAPEAADAMAARGQAQREAAEQAKLRRQELTRIWKSEALRFVQAWSTGQDEEALQVFADWEESGGFQRIELGSTKKSPTQWTIEDLREVRQLWRASGVSGIVTDLRARAPHLFEIQFAEHDTHWAFEMKILDEAAEVVGSLRASTVGESY
jgi:superfamily II RNA helicase